MGLEQTDMPQTSPATQAKTRSWQDGCNVQSHRKRWLGGEKRILSKEMA